MNIVILSGRLSAAPRRTELPSGTVVWALDVTTPHVDGARSVPVAWQGDVPDAWDAGTEVVVAGACRRRFFRVGGSTQSRTEVVAGTIVEVTKRRPAAAAVRAAARALGAEEVAALRSALATG